MHAKHSGRLTECILVGETEVKSYFQSQYELELLTCSLASGSLAASAIKPKEITHQTNRVTLDGKSLGLCGTSVDVENFLIGKCVLSRLQTSKFSMTSFYMTSFICQVHVCIYVRQILYDKFLVF